MWVRGRGGIASEGFLARGSRRWERGRGGVDGEGWWPGWWGERLAGGERGQPTRAVEGEETSGGEEDGERLEEGGRPRSEGRGRPTGEGSGREGRPEVGERKGGWHEVEGRPSVDERKRRGVQWVRGRAMEASLGEGRLEGG